jgi:lipoprotein NlpI
VAGQGEGAINPAIKERHCGNCLEFAMDKMVRSVAFAIAVALLLSKAAMAVLPAPEAPQSPPPNVPGPEAILILTQQIQSGAVTGPALAELYYSRGVAEGRIGRFDDASQDFTSAIKIVETTKYYSARGLAYASKKDFPDALRDFADADRLDPKSSFAPVMRAWIYQDMHDVPDYATELAKISARVPDSETLLSNRAEADFGRGRYDFAVVDYDAALALKPDATENIAGRSDALMMLGRYQEALSGYDKTIGIDPQGNTAQLARSSRVVSLYALGRYQDAVDAAIKNSDAKLDDPYSLFWLHYSRLRLQQDDKADFAGRAAKIDKTKWPWPVLAYELGETDEAGVNAKAEQGAAADLNGQHCEAAFHVGEQKLLSGNKKDAEPLLRRAASICPAGFTETMGADIELRRLEATK